MRGEQPSEPAAAAPAAGSAAERRAFDALQHRLPALFEQFGDPLAPRTVVVCPSLSLDEEVLARITGVRHYEERLLGMLTLLRLPRTRLVFLTSEPIAPVIVDYMLSHLSGVPTDHARQRLVMLSAHDASPVPLTRKLLARPRLVQRVREAIGDPALAHLSVFNATSDELSLAVALRIPLYACDPRLAHWGSKSGSRKAFRAAGIAHPDGAEDLRDLDDAAEAIDGLLARAPTLRRVVLKLDEGFSGDGNAVVDLSRWPVRADAGTRRAALVARLAPEARDLDAEAFAALFARRRGIVEAWVDGADKRSPSVQIRINPLGGIELISTHEQMLGGRSGQVFLGSRFPADVAYAGELQRDALRVAGVLHGEGVLGRFAVDFVSVATAQGWRHQAIEINLRKGGTTLPYQMLQFLTDGHYEPQRAAFVTPLGQPRCYTATDNLVNPAYRSLVPQDLIDLVVEHGLHFDPLRQEGVVFNLIGALSECGKLGIVSIAETPQAADAQFDAVRALLDRETGVGS